MMVPANAVPMAMVVAMVVAMIVAMIVIVIGMGVVNVGHGPF